MINKQIKGYPGKHPIDWMGYEVNEIRKAKIRATLKRKYKENPEAFKGITESSRNRKERVGYVNSPEARKKGTALLSKMWQEGKVTEKQKQTLFKKGFDIKRSNQYKIGHKCTETWKIKMRAKRALQIGEKCPAWKGGVSFEPYGIEFNDKLKEKIRQRDRFRCQECFRHQNELKEKLCIHHIDFNKKNNNPSNLISLCRPCHMQTNFNRGDWTNHFNEMLKISGGELKCSL